MEFFLAEFRLPKIMSLFEKEATIKDVKFTVKYTYNYTDYMANQRVVALTVL